MGASAGKEPAAGPGSSPRAADVASRRPSWAKNSGSHCEGCSVLFGVLTRRHHCRECGGLVCAECSRGRRACPALGYDEPVRVCRDCVAGVRALKEGFRDLYTRVNSAGQIAPRGWAESRERLQQREKWNAKSAVTAERLQKDHAAIAARRAAGRTARTDPSRSRRGSSIRKALTSPGSSPM
eukprot:TRINITY_DN3357_c0_g1_i1.p2 TRINITY_DN3357_c0_g1~~TRINITY_DN3357_c0_g1_i1.p2  ORF type:complete len:182 (+),score=33.93 TRINITY_DN3357_c0_g1_i1:104-649(+)